MKLTTHLGRTPAPRLAARFAVMEVSAALRKLARALGVQRPRALTLDDLPIPDSDVARAATALVERCEPAVLLNHSMRSYLFGAAVGRNLDLRYDPEVLFLACILHDIGLVDPYDGDGSFELNGAREARRFLLDREVEGHRADLVHEAIALHTAVGIADKRDPEIALLHFGAGLDVLGFRAEDVTPGTRDVIVEAWPRLDFKRQVVEMIEGQVARKPDCHIAGHIGLGMAKKVWAAPFPD